MDVAKEMHSALCRKKESGLSLMAFAKREKISYSKLLYWGRKFRDVEGKERKATPKVELTPMRVVPDAVPSEGPKAAVLAVWLANGVSLEIPVGFDASELERLVDVLSSC